MVCCFKCLLLAWTLLLKIWKLLFKLICFFRIIFLEALDLDFKKFHLFLCFLMMQIYFLNLFYLHLWISDLTLQRSFQFLLALFTFRKLALSLLLFFFLHSLYQENASFGIEIVRSLKKFLILCDLSLNRDSAFFLLQSGYLFYHEVSLCFDQPINSCYWLRFLLLKVIRLAAVILVSHLLSTLLFWWLLEEIVFWVTLRKI